jgi:general L-amino acid transport system substrate-binding protein
MNWSKSKSVGFTGAVLLLLASCQAIAPESNKSVATPSPTVSNPVVNSNMGVLERVKTRGKLICGLNGKSPGFSYVNDKGEWSGFDVDFCRAIAAAVLGSAKAVEYKDIPMQHRFTSLQTGEIDVLLHKTAWTLSRDTENAIAFAPTTFFDGQGLMVKQKPSKVANPSPQPELKLEDLSRKTICVESGNSEAKLVEVFKKLDTPFTPLSSEPDKVFSRYAKGECDAISGDKSQLAIWRSQLPKTSEHRILDIMLTKEPFSPVVISNDDRWHDVVSWVVYATFYAEELGINQKNLPTFKDSRNPEITSFLGTSDSLGLKLGLAPDWTTQVLKSVGNYGDIYARNLEPLGLSRGLNVTWQKGGLLYAMPFR